MWKTGPGGSDSVSALNVVFRSARFAGGHGKQLSQILISALVLRSGIGTEQLLSVRSPTRKR